MVTTHLRGHPIFWDNSAWRYADTKDPIDDHRPCARCGRVPTPEGYDACLGYIPNAASACCGHGVEVPFVLYQ
jgi:hypothetical protein